uniref:Thioesterase-like protein TwmA n=1 Tax=Talaromyces wortmannii TaxID=28567 RepID=TWMA_TALWO|nr:RecName: Full=Thioesterase-like protein TwmA; AltName: Full=Wortmanamides biosynthesis cluster protein A [Talaromyces wortmannii]AUY61969.1 TwnA [Talaromyces wortmannii]QBC19709.1 TwmA [Talaromyces wortmannii]
MASGKAGGASALFSEATQAEQLDSHTYRVNLNQGFCIGAVPNGGYTSACMLAAASKHLGPRGQPDTLTAHFEYPNRTSTGPAIVVIEDVKLGRQISTLHLTLWQGGLLSQAPWIDRSVSRRIVLAYTTHTNLRTFSGISMPTGYEVTPAAELPSVSDFEALKTHGADDAWAESKLPKGWAAMMLSLTQWRFYVPRKEPLSPGVLDMWIRLASGEKITQGALAYVVDSFPHNMHTFLAAPALRELLNASPERSGDSEVKDVRKKDQQRAEMWFPTVVMNIEAKTALPEEGVEWLSVRVSSKQIKEGKFDLEVLVRDTDGEMVALSNHVAMILSVERNTGKKSGSSKASL